MSKRNVPRVGEVCIQRCSGEDTSLLVWWSGRQIGHVYGWGETSRRLARALGEAAKKGALKR